MVTTNAIKFLDENDKELYKWAAQENKPYKTQIIPDGEELVGIYGQL